MINEMISRYQVIGELGRGGMAVVYKARDTTLDRNVAIKVILPDQQQTEKFLKRFVREAKTLAQLSHPNILKILDYGDHNGSPYLVTEYLPGGSLINYLGKINTTNDAANLLLPIAYALQHAHQQKVIHRDVKPQNILMNDAGEPMLADFGIAKLIDTDESQSLTGTGSMVGTPAYMAPEQVQGGTVDPRTDIYSLGVIFFELVTGRKPYTANTPVEVSLKHINEPIPKPRQFVRDLSSDAEKIIYKSMAKNPDDRYQTMGSFISALEKLTNNRKTLPRAIKENGKDHEDLRQKKVKKKPVRFAIILGGLIFCSAISVFFLTNQSSGSAFTRIGNQTTDSSATEVTETNATPEPKFTPTVTKPTKTITLPAVATKSDQSASITSQDGKVITSSNISQIVELGRIEKVSVITLDWANDGSVVVVAGSKALNLIDPKTMKSTGQIDLGGDVPKSVQISSDGKRIFVLGSTVRVYDLSTREILQTINIPGGANSLALSSDDKLIGIGVLNNKTQIINSEDGSVVRTNRSNFGGWSIAFSPDNELIASGTTSGSLMWDTQSGIWKPLSGGQDDIVKSLDFSKDGQWLAGGCNGKLLLWNVQTGAMSELKGNFSTVNSIDFSPDSNLLVTGNEDSTVRLYQVSNNELSELRVLKNHTSPVYGVQFSPTGDLIISGANEGIVRLWGLP